MSTITCNECNCKMSVHADACPSCGAPIDTIKAYGEFRNKYLEKIQKIWNDFTGRSKVKIENSPI